MHLNDKLDQEWNNAKEEKEKANAAADDVEDRMTAEDLANLSGQRPVRINVFQRAKKISAKELKKLGISLSDKIKGLKENHCKYLIKHRKLHGFSS